MCKTPGLELRDRVMYDLPRVGVVSVEDSPRAQRGDEQGVPLPSLLGARLAGADRSGRC